MKISLPARLLILTLFIAACTPAAPPDQSGEDRGPIYIAEAQLLIMESFPVQISLQITGELPTPCDELVSSIAQPDAQNRIKVQLGSIPNSPAPCIQVLEPFSISLPINMQGAADGIYSVWLNGELVGEFSYPG